MAQKLRLLEYLRKSRAEENMDTEEVLAKHHADLLEYVAAHPELEISETFKEVRSGESLYARPEMLRLLEAVETGQYDGVLCKDLDRLSRGRMTDQGIILDTLRWSNTLIYTPVKVYDLNDDTDEQMAEFKTFLSRQEWRLIRNRMQGGLKRSILDGCYVANAPYGYVKTMLGRKPTLAINEAEAVHVRLAFELYASGVGCTTIARRLNAMGAAPHRSPSFSRNTVAGILRNPTYIGKVVWNRRKHIKKGARGNPTHRTQSQPMENWIIAEGLHPPIVSQELFDKVQEIMKGRYIPPSNDGTIRSPLAGLVVCARCGHNMQRMGPKGKIPYLLCNTPGCCAGAKYAYVEEAVLSYLRRELERLTLERTAVPASSVSRLEATLETVQAELTAAKAAKNRLYEFLEQGVYDVDTFKMRMAAANEKLDAIQQRQAGIEEEISRSKAADPAVLARKIANVLASYEAADPAGRNALLRTVIDRIYYSKDKKTAQRDFVLDFVLKPN